MRRFGDRDDYLDRYRLTGVFQIRDRMSHVHAFSKMLHARHDYSQFHIDRGACTGLDVRSYNCGPFHYYPSSIYLVQHEGNGMVHNSINE